jgi:hypothetical protein
MKAELIKVDPAEFGLEPAQAAEVETVFLPVIAERNALAESYDAIVGAEITPALIDEAHELRMKLVKVRTNTDKIHKAAKAFYLSGGRFVDAWKNRNLVAITLMEDKLFEIEDHFEQIERDRIEALKQVRFGRLCEVCEHPEFYQYELMTDEAFEDLIQAQTLMLTAKREAAAEAERLRVKALEDQRIENERIRTENLRLEAERQKLEKEREAERKKVAKDREAADKLLEAERKKLAETDRALKLNVERMRVIELEKEQREEAMRSEAQAPLRDKMERWLNSLEVPVGDTPNEVVDDIAAKLDGFKSWSRKQLKNL